MFLRLGRIVTLLFGLIIIASCGEIQKPNSTTAPQITKAATSSPIPEPTKTVTEIPTVSPIATPPLAPTATPICESAIEANLGLYDYVGHEIVEAARITTCEIWKVGAGTVQGVVEKENDAMILTRVAMGENSQNLAERIYIMWFIRLRAELGYKNDGYRGFVQPEDRWWHEPTTIKEEALCIGGCQFIVVKSWQYIYFPANINEGQLTGMIYPSDNQIHDFYLTYQAALYIVSASISEFPHDLRGYDEFRTGSVTNEGLYYREGGLPSIAFYKETVFNTFRDVSPYDNVFWENMKENLK